MNAHQSLIISYLKKTYGAAAEELCRAADIAQPTLSRQLAALGSEVVRFGSARSTRYYGIRRILRNEYQWPIYRVMESGELEKGGILTSVYPNQWHFEAENSLSVFNQGDFNNGIYPGLPWFLENMRPQGFLGRVFVKQYASHLRLGSDARLWTSEDLLSALLSHGVDCPGNLIVGNDAAKIYQHQRHEQRPLPQLESRSTLYPDFASGVLRGNAAGSSAGGEQQKFTTALASAAGDRHVIVKFSPPLDTPAGRRWGDLLVCEHIASEVLNENRIPAAHSEVIIADNRIFLESTRFDRRVGHGRLGSYSCMNFDAAYYGDLDDWHAFANRLDSGKWLPEADTRTLRILYAFGTMIGNTDMHFGNISLLQENNGSLRLAPSYDMLPMLYAPLSNGEVIEKSFSVIPPTPSEYESWQHAFPISQSFWERVQSHPLIDPTFKEIIAGNAKKVQESMKGIHDRMSRQK